MALLWFYTFGSQMFKNEDGYSDSDIKAASLILSECKNKFPNSAIFQFFQGRVERMKVSFKREKLEPNFKTKQKFEILKGQYKKRYRVL